jgi:hypothetical protein
MVADLRGAHVTRQLAGESGRLLAGGPEQRNRVAAGEQPRRDAARHVAGADDRDLHRASPRVRRLEVVPSRRGRTSGWLRSSSARRSASGAFVGGGLREWHVEGFRGGLQWDVFEVALRFCVPADHDGCWSVWWWASSLESSRSRRSAVGIEAWRWRSKSAKFQICSPCTPIAARSWSALAISAAVSGGPGRRRRCRVRFDRQTEQPG